MHASTHEEPRINEAEWLLAFSHRRVQRSQLCGLRWLRLHGRSPASEAWLKVMLVISCRRRTAAAHVADWQVSPFFTRDSAPELITNNAAVVCRWVPRIHLAKRRRAFSGTAF